MFKPNKSTFKSFKEEKAEEKAREKGKMVRKLHTFFVFFITLKPRIE